MKVFLFVHIFVRLCHYPERNQYGSILYMRHPSLNRNYSIIPGEGLNGECRSVASMVGHFSILNLNRI